MASTRATANPNVGDAEYAALLHTWFATRTVECWTSLFRDTELVSQKNKVRPHTLIDMAKLLESFIDAGCKNCMVFLVKLERAILKVPMMML